MQGAICISAAFIICLHDSCSPPLRVHILVFTFLLHPASCIFITDIPASYYYGRFVQLALSFLWTTLTNSLDIIG